MHVSFPFSPWAPEIVLQSTLFFCSPTSRVEHGQRLALNTANLRKYHHSLYLGGGGLQPFRDERLINFWTYKQLPETLYYEADASGLPAFVSSNRTLWEMGNVFLGAIEDIYVFRDEWAADMDKESQWQYAFVNGPGGCGCNYASFFMTVHAVLQTSGVVELCVSGWLMLKRYM